MSYYLIIVHNIPLYKSSIHIFHSYHT